jgi:outer membrane lipoprotein-sorting protein
MTVALLMAILSCLPAFSADTKDADRIVKEALDYWRDVSSYSEMTMTIHRPDWERHLRMKAWTQGEKNALVRFVEPAKDAGSATLKLGDDMWIFTPKLNKVVRLPFSMMAQSWMGSDFSYNDLAKSDDLLIHFTNTVISTEETDGHKVYLIEAIPRPDSPVIWGKETVKIRDDRLLLEETFFDQDLKPLKRMRTLEIQPLGGKPYMTRLRMEELDEKEHWTDIKYEQAKFGLDLPSYLFTQSNLRNPRENQ